MVHGYCVTIIKNETLKGDERSSTVAGNYKDVGMIYTFIQRNYRKPVFSTFTTDVNVVYLVW